MQLSDALSSVNGNGAKADRQSTAVDSGYQNSPPAAGTKYTQFSAIFTELTQAEETRESGDIAGRHPNITGTDAEETHPEMRGESRVETDAAQRDEQLAGENENEELAMGDKAPIERGHRRATGEPTDGRGTTLQSAAEASLWPKAGENPRIIPVGTDTHGRSGETRTAQAAPKANPAQMLSTPAQVPPQPAEDQPNNLVLQKVLSQQAVPTTKNSEVIFAAKSAENGEVLYHATDSKKHASELPRQNSGERTTASNSAQLNPVQVGSSTEPRHLDGKGSGQISRVFDPAETQKLVAVPNALGEPKPSKTEPATPHNELSTKGALNPRRDLKSTSNESKNQDKVVAKPDTTQPSQTGLAATKPSANYSFVTASNGQPSSPPQLGIATTKAGREVRSDLPSKDRPETKTSEAAKTRTTLIPQARAANMATSAAQLHQSSDTADNLRLGLGASDADTEAELIQTPLTEQSRSVSQTPTQFAVKAAIPQHIPPQLAEVIHTSGSKTVDVALSPEELGRVRLSISQAEAGLIVNVQAERPETLDMLRRNIDQLDQELKLLGYADPGFSFSHEGDGTPQQSDIIANENSLMEDQPELPAADAIAENAPTPLGDTGLDIRI
ncbi:hook-length control protein FliK [Sulfitobacter marinus]|uniref:Hook-length control protein FliK n=1 Tax=Sulfitobacter marinus TaxID=394264 RepID=A0A1I6TDH1_9RHOB|nr:flagellar hook-length control protein FliK [Sulfitobacter marinus]SFS87203.1 hook-length control protein FliK [Sulfitobacter marinus]